MGTVAGKFKMWMFKFSIIFCLVCVPSRAGFAKDLEVLGVETAMNGDFGQGAPQVEVRVRLKSLSSERLYAPRGEILLEAPDGRVHREVGELIAEVIPGFEIDTKLRFQVPHWWAAASPTLRFELLDYRVNEPLEAYRERLKTGTVLQEATVAASLGISTRSCKRWGMSDFADEALAYLNAPIEKYMRQEDGFLRIALVLGLRQCRPELATGLREKLPHGVHVGLEEVLQILVSDLDAQAERASPMARWLPVGTRTLKDLFEEPLRPSQEISLTGRYGGAASSSTTLDTSMPVALEDITQSGRASVVVFTVLVFVIIGGLVWRRRRDR